MSRHRGSAIGTRAWSRLRAPYIARLLAGQTIPCAARRTKACLVLITRPSEFRLGHVIARTNGGQDTDGLQPECRPCSDHEGGTLATTKTNPSREW